MKSFVALCLCFILFVGLQGTRNGKQTRNKTVMHHEHSLCLSLSSEQCNVRLQGDQRNSFRVYCNTRTIYTMFVVTSQLILSKLRQTTEWQLGQDCENGSSKEVKFHAP